MKRSTRILIRHGAIPLSLFIMLGVATAQAEQKKDSGPTQSQIDCKNRAVNDYYAQTKECDKALRDIPAQNTLCKSDAAADMKQRKAGCMAKVMQ
jgi:hypothetical protein